jgi:DNA-binding beta-propeller fold protein YncE
VSPGSSIAFLPESETLFFNASDADGNHVYRLQGLSSGFPEKFYSSQSTFSGLFAIAGGQSLLLCFLGPEWAVKRINSTTGALEGQFDSPWPITNAAISPDGSRLLLANSGTETLLEISTASMGLRNSIDLSERPGPFTYNTSGNILLFNQYAIRPSAYLYNGETLDLLMSVSTVNSYRLCSLIPGTNVVIAPRRSDSRVSVLNTENLIFAPSLFTIQYPKLAFASSDGEYLLALTDAPGRVYVFRRP